VAWKIKTMTSTDDARRAPLEAVLKRLRDDSGFPTLSTTISDINRVVASEAHSAQQLTQVILRDVSLTTKLLQVVNSATYGQYRGRIRTVSKAVLILGAEAVRNAAMTLMMLEFSRGRPQERSLQDELIGAFFAGVVSKALCQRLGMPNSEEAMICTMFQSLGRLLVTFFLFEESRRVRALIETGVPEEEAAARVLGISYRDLGVGVARHWNFPDRLVEGMQSLTEIDMKPPATDAARLKLAANLANDLYVTALRCSQADKPAALEALSKRYRAAIKIDATTLIDAMDQGLKEVAERSTTLQLPTANSPTLNVIRIWTGGAPDAVEPERGSAQNPAVQIDDTIMRHVNSLDALEGEGDAALDPQQVLSAGIRDVTETLTADFALNDVLHMVLETMYRGMGFSRTMVFIRDARLNTMRARFGFGADVERIIPQCNFPIAFAPDVFHVALQKGADIVIDNTQAENIAQRIPQWHRQVISARSFLLLPVMLKNHAVGLLYADSDRADGVKIGAEQLGLLRTLRSQVVLAFKHSAASGRT
jgi:HD-like signal output (HDOD) protein